MGYNYKMVAIWIRVEYVQVNDKRLGASTAYSKNCLKSGEIIHGVSETIKISDGSVVDRGEFNGSLILEYNDWATHNLVTLAMGILVQEVVRIPDQ